MESVTFTLSNTCDFLICHCKYNYPEKICEIKEAETIQGMAGRKSTKDVKLY